MHLSIDVASHLADALRPYNLCLFTTEGYVEERDDQHGTALSVDPLGGAEENNWLALRKWRVVSRNPNVQPTVAQAALFEFMNSHPCIVASEAEAPEWANVERLNVEGIRAFGATHCIFATPTTYAADAEALQPGSTANPDPADAT